MPFLFLSEITIHIRLSQVFTLLLRSAIGSLSNKCRRYTSTNTTEVRLRTFIFKVCAALENWEWPLTLLKTLALSFQQKILVWNCRTFTSGCSDLTQAPARLYDVYCSCKQYIYKRRGTGDNNFVKWKGTFRSDRPKWPDRSKHLQSWSRVFRSDQTEMLRSIWCINRILRDFGLNENHPTRSTS